MHHQSNKEQDMEYKQHHNVEIEVVLKIQVDTPHTNVDDIMGDIKLKAERKRTKDNETNPHDLDVITYQVTKRYC